MVKKILLADVCLSRAFVRGLKRKDITVLEVKKTKDPSARYLPENVRHPRRPWGDSDILEFAKRKGFIIITADKGLARRYEYGILVTANCQKAKDIITEIQLEQAIEQYEMIKKNGRLRRILNSGFPARDTKPVFVEAFGETFHIPPFEN